MKSKFINQVFLLELIKFLKPEFYNKITWLVVNVGLGLIATPFWQKLVITVLKQKYNLDLMPGGNVWWGLALAILGLSYHMTTHTLLKYIEYKKYKFEEKKKEEIRKHDIKIFKDSEKILKEQDLIDFLERLQSDHSYRDNDFNQLYKYARFLLSLENYYIDKDIQKAAIVLAESIENLLGFIAQHFFVYPRNQKGKNIKHCLYPDWNVDRGGSWEHIEKYEKFVKELEKLCEKVEKNYETYRLLIKGKLLV